MSKIDGKTAEEWNSQCLAHHAEGDYAATLAAIEKALKLDPTSPQYHSRKGFALDLLRRSEEAIPYYNKAIELDPSYLQPHINLACRYKEQGKFDLAIEWFDKAIAIEAKSTFFDGKIECVGEQMAILKQSDGNEAEIRAHAEIVITYYDERLSLFPDDCISYRYKGNNLWILGRHDEALVCYEEAIRLDSTYAGVYRDKGNLLKELGQNEEALDACVKCLEVAQDDQVEDILAASEVVGALLESLNRQAEAIPHYDRAIELADDVGKTRISLNKALLLGELGRYDDAIILCNEVLVTDTNNICTLLTKAQLLHDVERDREAVWCLETALSQEPGIEKQIEIYNRLGVSMCALYDVPKAIKHFQQSILLDPINNTAHYHLGLMYKVEGRHLDAIKEFDFALEHRPHHLLAMSAKIESLVALDRSKEALDLLQILSQTMQDHPEAFNNLSDGNKTFIQETAAERTSLIKQVAEVTNEYMALMADTTTEDHDGAGAAAGAGTAMPSTVLPPELAKELGATINVAVQKVDISVVESFIAKMEALKLEVQEVRSEATAAHDRAARLENIALTVDSAPHLARDEADAKEKDEHLERIGAHAATQEYYETFQRVVNEHFLGFKATRSGVLAVTSGGGIPGVDTVSGFLPPIAQQCVAVINAGIKLYQEISFTNDMSRATALFVGITTFEATSEEVARNLSLLHKARIIAATDDSGSIMRMWKNVKDKVVVDTYDTPAKKLAMQDGLMLLSAMRAGIFTPKEDLAEKFAAFITDERITKGILTAEAEGSAIDSDAVVVAGVPADTSQPTDAAGNGSKKSGKCIIMCQDTLYDNPVLNTPELVEALIKGNVFNTALHITSGDLEAASSLVGLYQEFGQEGVDAWVASV